MKTVANKVYCMYNVTFGLFKDYLGLNTIAITPKSEDKYVEKCSTAQSFIRTEMSTYRIGTLPMPPKKLT